jgi:hypothetical protein
VECVSEAAVTVGDALTLIDIEKADAFEKRTPLAPDGCHDLIGGDGSGDEESEVSGNSGELGDRCDAGGLAETRGPGGYQKDEDLGRDAQTGGRQKSGMKLPQSPGHLTANENLGGLAWMQEIGRDESWQTNCGQRLVGNQIGESDFSGDVLDKCLGIEEVYGTPTGAPCTVGGGAGEHGSEMKQFGER